MSLSRTFGNPAPWDTLPMFFCLLLPLFSFALKAFALVWQRSMAKMRRLDLGRPPARAAGLAPIHL